MAGDLTGMRNDSFGASAYQKHCLFRCGVYVFFGVVCMCFCVCVLRARCAHPANHRCSPFVFLPRSPTAVVTLVCVKTRCVRACWWNHPSCFGVSFLCLPRMLFSLFIGYTAICNVLDLLPSSPCLSFIPLQLLQPCVFFCAFYEDRVATLLCR